MNQENERKTDGKIFCWNVNGIREVLKNGTFTRFLEQHNPEVLCLNETKIDEIALAREDIKQKLAKWFPTDL